MKCTIWICSFKMSLILLDYIKQNNNIKQRIKKGKGSAYFDKQKRFDGLSTLEPKLPKFLESGS